MGGQYWIETLGCPKNQVDSDKLEGLLAGRGLSAAADPTDAELVVVNTCAFVEEARAESVETILALSDRLSPDTKLVVTGCMAERYGDELAEALPEVSAVVGFGHELDAASTPVTLGRRPAPPTFDLLNLPRPKSSRPWAYVKIAEGCDRACGFCAIPTFRGPQRSRSIDAIVEEVRSLEIQEAVLVAQDLAAYGRDGGLGERRINELVEAVAAEVAWVRLLYLYPSDLNDRLIDTIVDTGVSYFDLSLQHASAPLLRKMRRFGNADLFLDRIAAIRRKSPDAVFRSNVIIGYPGETEEDHDTLLRFVREAELDWLGVFSYSAEEGTYAAGLADVVPEVVVNERRAEVTELADSITLKRRLDLVGTHARVLVDAPGEARSYREAPEIDGIIEVPIGLTPGMFHDVRITDAKMADLVAEPIDG